MSLGRNEPDARERGESGVATIWGMAWLLVCLTIGWVALVLTVAVADQHHVDASADLASLSAADRLQHGGRPCRTAAAVAVANGALLASCRVAGQDVIVSVRARIDLPFGLHPWVTSQARAGP